MPKIDGSRQADHLGTKICRARSGRDSQERGKRCRSGCDASRGKEDGERRPRRWTIGTWAPCVTICTIALRTYIVASNWTEESSSRCLFSFFTPCEQRSEESDLRRMCTAARRLCIDCREAAAGVGIRFPFRQVDARATSLSRSDRWRSAGGDTTTLFGPDGNTFCGANTRPAVVIISTSRERSSSQGDEDRLLRARARSPRVHNAVRDPALAS